MDDGRKKKHKMGDILEGFTPIMDDLVDIFGRPCASVYGCVWRYTQMSSGKCNASQTKIGKRVGLNRPAVNKWLKQLCADGYLLDETPGLVNKTHTYSVLIHPKIGISITMPQKNTETDATVPSKNTKQTSTVLQGNKKILNTKIPTNNQDIPRTANAPSNQAVMFKAIADITEFNIKIGSNAAVVGRAAKELLEGGETPERVYALRELLWKDKFWRDKGIKPYEIKQHIHKVKTTMSRAEQIAFESDV